MRWQTSHPFPLWKVAILFLTAMLSWAGGGTAATLDDIRATKSIRIA